MEAIIGLLFIHSIEAQMYLQCFMRKRIKLYFGMSVTIVPEHECPSPVNPSLQVQS